MGIRIDALDAVASAADDHEIPAMKDGATVRLSVAQISTKVQGDLADDLGGKAPLNSPAFTGNPTVPTPSLDDDDTSIPNTGWVQDEIADAVAISPLTEKTTLADADLIRIADSAASNQAKKVTLANLKQALRNKVALIGDSKAQNTAAQTYSTANTWATRDLNTEFSDVDGIVSIAANQFTLLSGANYLVEYSASYRLNAAIVSHRIYDVTSGAVVAGSYAVTSYDASGTTVYGYSNGRALLVGGRTYRVEVLTGNSGVILGATLNLSGIPETYLTMSIQALN